MYIFLIPLAIALIIFIIYSIRERNNKKHLNFVKLNSIALKELYALNDEYDFYNIPVCNIVNTYDNEIFFSQISCEDYLIYQLQFEQYKIKQQIKMVESNCIKYKQYKLALNSIVPVGNYAIPCDGLKVEKLHKIERELLRKSVLRPTVSYAANVTLYLSEINGSVYRHKRQIFNADEILMLIKRINNKSGTFYNDRGIWDAICRVERGKVSNKMRFAIYKRDGYRCRKCGVSDARADLEIDHIIPIAKGGKTTYNNLQPLCHKCNKEKSDTMPY